MNKNGLTITMIFDASSANYSESIGNISQLKKMTRSGGEIHTYISRQAIRYNIVQQMQIDNTPVDKEQKVVQFSPNTTIKDYPEIDLFGYMKTKQGDKSKKGKEDNSKKGGQSIRSAVVRLSNAISLEPYKSDTDFLNNIGLAKRSGLENDLAQSEIHKSLYSYTITIDLDKIGTTLGLETRWYVSDTPAQLKHLFSELYSAAETEPIGYFKIKAIELLYHMDQLTQINGCDLKYFDKKQIQSTKAIREYLVSHLDEKVSLEQMAKEAHLNLSVFHLVFSHIYGDTPYAYLKKYKMNLAAQWLSKDKMKIGDIALELGYSNASKFAKAFQSVYGMLPKDYRKNK
mgnify:CR=1 FL=1